VVESLGDCETCEEVLEWRWPRGGRLCGCGLAGASSPPAIVSNPVVPSRVYLVVDCLGVGYQWAASSATRCSDCALVMTAWPWRRDKTTPAIREGRPGLPASPSVKWSSIQSIIIFTSQVISFFFIPAWIHMSSETINVNAPVKQYILIMSSSPAARFAARHADLDM